MIMVFVLKLAQIPNGICTQMHVVCEGRVYFPSRYMFQQAFPVLIGGHSARNFRAVVIWNVATKLLKDDWNVAGCPRMLRESVTDSSMLEDYDN